MKNAQRLEDTHNLQVKTFYVGIVSGILGEYARTKVRVEFNDSFGRSSNTTELAVP